MVMAAPSAASTRHRPPPRGVYPRLQQPEGSAPLRALQLLRERQPLPQRRQSVPATFGPPPRGPPPPLPLLPRAISLSTEQPNTHAPVVGKPPPPSTQHPLVAIDAAGGGSLRRRSTGNIPRGPPPGSLIRPPPPRGPRPAPSAAPPGGAASVVPDTSSLSATAAGVKAPLHAAQADVVQRRRSSDARAPPPGPPPPGQQRKASVPVTIPLGQVVGRPPTANSDRSEQPLDTQGETPLAQAGLVVEAETASGNASAAAASATAEVVAAKVAAAGAAGAGAADTARRVLDSSSVQGDAHSGTSALRKVSFSTQGGPHADPVRDAGGKNISRPTVHPFQPNCEKGAGLGAAAGGKDAGKMVPHGSTTVQNPTQSLPQLQYPRRSSRNLNGVGIPPASRPPGKPPSPSREEIRRYSISNEISAGDYNFSRRMSAAADARGPEGTSSPSPLTHFPAKNGNQSPNTGAGATGPQNDIGTGGSSDSDVSGSDGNENINQSSSNGQQTLAPSQGRPAVLWYNMGVTKQQKGDARGAVECYQRAAKEGHAKARHNLAAIYEKGMPGVPKDDAEAVRLFRLAAEQGLAESAYSLAMHLKFGLGVAQDDAQCVFYLEQASEHGLAKAMFNLGLMYEKHRGISSNVPQADLLEATQQCYEAAAEAGVTKAMVNLGVLYLSGRMSEHEKGEALGWFKKAADEGDLSGLWNLGLCYERGVGVSRDPIAAQAIQQQCRDRESRQRQLKLRGAPSMTDITVDGKSVPGRYNATTHPRRFSEPLALADRGQLDDSNNSSDGNLVNGSGTRTGNKRINEKRRLSMRRSASVPLVTPPPPKGEPPPSLTRGNVEAACRESDPKALPSSVSGMMEEPEATTSTPEGRLSTSSSKVAYKYVPRSERPPQPAVAAAAGAAAAAAPAGRPAAEGMATETAGDGAAIPREAAEVPGWVPPPPRERKNSLLLKPTPQAIARVKAAVERRKMLQAKMATAATATTVAPPR